MSCCPLQAVSRLMINRAGEVFYIGGNDVLPAPLEPQKEAFVLEKFGTSQEDEAKSLLIEHNLRLVVYIAKKFDNTGVGVEDLISIGTIGLIKAINTFDPIKNIKLATYASRCIENEILMSLRFSKKFQNDISLHEPIGTDRDGNEIVMLDVINSNTPDFAEQLHLSIESEKMLHAVKEKLNEREQTVVILRYGLWGQEEQTQQEIAQQLGISRSYVSRHVYCKCCYFSSFVNRLETEI